MTTGLRWLVSVVLSAAASGSPGTSSSDLDRANRDWTTNEPRAVRWRAHGVSEGAGVGPKQLRSARHIVAILGLALFLGGCGSGASIGPGSGSQELTPGDAGAEQVGEPLVVGIHDATAMPDPQCSPRADGEPSIDVDRPVSLEEGLRIAMREWGLPQELLHAPALDGSRQRVYVAISDDQVAAVVRMILADSGDGEIQAWVADRAIRCPRLLGG